MPSKSTLARFRSRVVSWFRRHGRPLPWRATRDPYRVLVSEFMLQQTQVSRVEGYYRSFLDRYPTIHDLARARPATVRESWDGLGYYRRAANLHRLARQVVADHDGMLPDDREALRALPGVGEYTAGAVLAFAFERAEPAVDTNVSRVLRRAFHPRLGSGAAVERRLRATAKELLGRSGKSAWTMSQGIMELGALICTARTAWCERCPARPVCATGRRTVTAGGQRR